MHTTRTRSLALTGSGFTVQGLISNHHFSHSQSHICPTPEKHRAPPEVSFPTRLAAFQAGRGAQP